MRTRSGRWVVERTDTSMVEPVRVYAGLMVMYVLMYSYCTLVYHGLRRLLVYIYAVYSVHACCA